MPEWALVVHGGAKPIPRESQPDFQRGTAAAADAGRAVLEAGGTAVDAVTAAVSVLESDPTFNAGYGSVLNEDGEVECDAAIMDGATLDAGAVAGARTLRHPIDVASRLLREPTVLLVGDGADRFARLNGGATCEPRELISPDQAASGGDTVGCVALDSRGDLAAATSTGGLDGKHRGRVGDSAVIGSGLYADNELGAISLSGTGEHIIRLVLAARILDERDSPHAIDDALTRLGRIGGEGGIILLDPSGHAHWGHSSAEFAVATADSETEIRTFIRKGDDS